MAAQESVSLGGHTFTADLPDGWVVSDIMKADSFDQSNPDNSLDSCLVTDSWKGTFEEAFNFLAYPNAPKNSTYYGTLTGRVYIYVTKIPDDLRQSFQERDIALYGSVDKITDDQKAKDTSEILTEAAHIGLACPKDNIFDSEKDITFNDHEAHLTESDTSALEHVWYWLYSNFAEQRYGGHNSTAYSNRAYGCSTDSTLFDGSAWDVMTELGPIQVRLTCKISTSFFLNLQGLLTR